MRGREGEEEEGGRRWRGRWKERERKAEGEEGERVKEVVHVYTLRSEDLEYRTLFSSTDVSYNVRTLHEVVTKLLCDVLTEQF